MQLQEICADVFLVLRRHISLFFNLLLVMAKADPPVTDLIFDAKYLVCFIDLLHIASVINFPFILFFSFFLSYYRRNN